MPDNFMGVFDGGVSNGGGSNMVTLAFNERY